ncbi:MAG: hypothetical protein JOY53_01975 [Acidobacteriaceae bacterium]|nr:hypothetical protein [Acidobacteriaceae bacterium]
MPAAAGLLSAIPDASFDGFWKRRLRLGARLAPAKSQISWINRATERARGEIEGAGVSVQQTH